MLTQLANRIRFEIAMGQGRFVSCWIILPGQQDIPVRGLDGLGLKKVPRSKYIDHDGLKYWSSSDVKGLQDCLEVKKILSQRAREDVMNRIFHKKLRPFEGVRYDKITKKLARR